MVFLSCVDLLHLCRGNRVLSLSGRQVSEKDHHLKYLCATSNLTLCDESYFKNCVNCYDMGSLQWLVYQVLGNGSSVDMLKMLAFSSVINVLGS